MAASSRRQRRGPCRSQPAVAPATAASSHMPSPSVAAAAARTALAYATTCPDGALACHAAATADAATAAVARTTSLKPRNAMPATDASLCCLAVPDAAVAPPAEPRRLPLAARPAAPPPSARTAGDPLRGAASGAVPPAGRDSALAFSGSHAAVSRAEAVPAAKPAASMAAAPAASAAPPPLTPKAGAGRNALAVASAPSTSDAALIRFSHRRCLTASRPSDRALPPALPPLLPPRRAGLLPLPLLRLLLRVLLGVRHFPVALAVREAGARFARRC